MPTRAPLVRLAAGAMLALTGLTALGPTPAAAQTPAYTVVDLGSFAATGDAVSECADFYGGGATAINADGQVTGTTAWGDRPSAAFRATDGNVKRLKSGKGGGVGYDINDAGQVVGSITDDRNADLCDFSGPSPAVHAATWIGGELTELPVAGAERSRATAINDDGVIVGSYDVTKEVTEVDDTSTSTSRYQIPMPVVWREGEMRELPLPDGAETAVGAAPRDINAGGQIVGLLQGLGNFDYVGSVLWEDDEATLLPEGFLATAINDDGVIYGLTNEATRAARLVDGKLKKLPGIPDGSSNVSVVAANADGSVVGSIQEKEGEPFSPTLWQGNEAIAISTLLPKGTDWTSFYASDINDTGMILVNATTEEGERVAGILVPKGT